MGRARAELVRFVILTRHFFGRLFRNETVDFEDQMKERLSAVLALLAVFFAWSSWLLLFKYHFVPDLNRSWQEKNYIFTLMMLTFAVITLLEWDVLLPDRRDFLNLTPLPVRLRTVYAAKLASFLLFIGMFSVAMTSIPSVLFSIYLTEWRTKSLALGGRYIFSHILSGFAANAAVFFAVVFLQFLLMAVLPKRLYQSASLAVRFALTAGLVLLLLGFIAEPSILGRSFHSLGTLKEAGDPWLLRFPPLWFVGLYEVMVGIRDPFFAAQALTAGRVLVLALAAFALSSALSYHRHVRKTLEARKGRPALLPLREGWRRLLGATVLRSHEERAVYAFFADTLKASGKHRMALTNYLGVALAAILLVAVTYKDSLRSMSPSSGLVLALPLVVALTLVLGVRVLVDRPVAPEANWVFRLTETPRPEKYVSGLKKAVVLKFLLPFFGIVFLLHAMIWPGWQAGLHAAFGALVSLLAVEAAFFGYRKVPFAATYLPGKLKLQFTAIPLIIVLPPLLSALAAVEKGLLRRPAWGLVFLMAVAASKAGSWALNKRCCRGRTLIYEEAPEPALISFPEAS
jgi:hypothetical protein